MGDEGLKFDLGGPDPPARAPLAHVADFALGSLSIEPALRRVSRGETISEQIEPLVMQILITLASARETTLSRDDLMTACWDGRFVSDDAINQVISRLRRILERVGDGSVRLETVPKVGYRLSIGSERARNAVPKVAVVPEQLNRRWWPIPGTLLAAGGALLVMGASVMAVSALDRDAGFISVAVESSSVKPGDREANRFSSDLTSDLARMTGAISLVNVIDAGQGRVAGRPDLLVRVSVAREGGNLTAQARLVDAADGSVLWSDRFEDDSGVASRLRERVAIATAEVMRCGLERSAAMLDDPATIRLFFAACDAMRNQDFARAHSFARQVVARQPDSAAAWACMAFTVLHAAGKMDGGSSPESARRLAKAYAKKAIALDPHVGRAYIALAAAAGADDPRSIDLLRQGTQADTELPETHKAYSQALYNLGYVRASAAPALRGLALDPASRTAHELAVRRLLGVGRVEEAMAVQARAERLWPGHPELLDHRIRMLPDYPDPGAAQRLLDSLDLDEAAMPPLMHAVVRWRAGQASLDHATLDSQAEAWFQREQSSAWTIAAAMSLLGERERAFAWLARAPRKGAMKQWSVLFTPPHSALRRDPRFFAAMAELGLVEIWRKRNQWPDFCSEPGLAYDCRREAARMEPITTQRNPSDAGRARG